MSTHRPVYKWSKALFVTLTKTETIQMLNSAWINSEEIVVYPHNEVQLTLKQHAG